MCAPVLLRVMLALTGPIYPQGVRVHFMDWRGAAKNPLVEKIFGEDFANTTFGPDDRGSSSSPSSWDLVTVPGCRACLV